MESPPKSSSKVSNKTISAAVKALLKWKSQNSQSEKPQLLPTDEFLYLVLTLTKIPAKSRVNAYKIPLPHPLYAADTAEFCLFVHDSISKAAKAKVAEQGLPISQVIKLSKLKKNYKAYEQKRKLCDSFDMFFADKRIVPLLPNAIGSGFYKKKKIPVPVELGRGNWKEQIERVCSSGLLYLSTGTCCVIRVAKAAMSEDEIVENVVAAVEGVAAVVPKKWSGVRSFHLKFAESLALPVYQKVPEVGFKIAGGEVAGEGKKAGEKGEKAKKGVEEGAMMMMKKKKKKGRLHEVRYMDEEVLVGGEDVDEGVSEGEGEEVVDVEEKEVVDVEDKEVAGKKRKKGNVVTEKKVKEGEKGLKKVKKGLGVKKIKKSKVSV